MDNYEKFNKLRNLTSNDLEKSLKKIDDLAKMAECIFKNTDRSLDILCEIHTKIELADRSLNSNSALWEINLKWLLVIT